MTKEEVIKFLRFEMSYYCDLKGSEELQAYNMAIKALEQEPCEDCVSRQAVLNTIGNVPDHDDGMVFEALSHAQRDVALLPSVTPQQETVTEFADRCQECGSIMGKWIFHKPFDNGRKNCNECIECSQCHIWLGHDCYAKTLYCPNCGAKMEAENDD